MFFIELLLSIIVLLIELPEVISIQFLEDINDKLEFIKTPFSRFIFYLLCCLTFIACTVGYSWVVSVYVFLEMLIYGYISFIGE